MPDITVSSTIDTFMQAADQPTARGALGLRLGNDGSTRFTWFDHFINGLTFRDGFSATSANGGSVPSIGDTTLVGMVRAQSGTGASANASAGVGAPGSPSVVNMGFGAQTFFTRARNGATLYDAVTVQGTVRHGLLDSFTITAPVDGAYFRSTNGAAWECVVRQANLETVVNTGIALDSGVWHTFQVETNAAATEVRFYYDGTLVAFFTSVAGVDSGFNRYGVTTLPVTGSYSFGSSTARSTAIATNVFHDLDLMLYSYAPVTPFTIVTP